MKVFSDKHILNLLMYICFHLSFPLPPPPTSLFLISAKFLKDSTGFGIRYCQKSSVDADRV